MAIATTQPQWTSEQRQMSQTLSSEARFHGLDFCRAVFMCLGLVFHCGLIYGTGQDWRVVSEETLPVIKYLANFIHHFRMEAFYLVSGFFYALVFVKGQRSFMKDRISRVLIPMLVVGLTLNPVMNELSYNRDYASGIQYFMSGQWLGHLWFLGNLLVYFLVSRQLCFWLSQRGLSHQCAPLQHKVYFQALMVLWALALVGHILAKSLSLSSVLFINFGYLFYYYPYFLLGILSFVAKAPFYALIRLRHFPLYLLAYALLQLLAKLDIGIDAELLDVLKMASHLPLMLAAFSLLNFIGDRDSSLVREFSQASYTIYLVHQPLIIILYVLFFEKWQLGAMLEFCLLIFVVLLISYGFHHLLVSRFWFLKLALNGDTKR